MTEETLADKRIKNGTQIPTKDVKEKIQNVQKRLKEGLIIPNDEDSFVRNSILNFIDKIFNEEIGEGLLK